MKSTISVDLAKQALSSRGTIALDARSRKPYLRSHIPGALHADFFHYLIPGTDSAGLATFHHDLGRMLSSTGLEGNEKALVYESAFGMRAARIAWMLQYAGMKRVSIIEGGFGAWRRAGFPVETRSVEPKHSDFRLKPDPSILATTDFIAEGPSRKLLILDVRSEGEFAGSEKRDCCARSGHIPGAVWLEWTQFVHGGSDFEKGPKIKGMMDRLGLDPAREVVTYCHRGARAASVFYALRALGFRQVRNYFGSWHEWSSKPQLPTESSSLTKP